jgi:hypothetical protein
MHACACAWISTSYEQQLADLYRAHDDPDKRNHKRNHKRNRGREPDMYTADARRELERARSQRGLEAHQHLKKVREVLKRKERRRRGHKGQQRQQHQRSPGHHHYKRAKNRGRNQRARNNNGHGQQQRERQKRRELDDKIEQALPQYAAGAENEGESRSGMEEEEGPSELIDLDDDEAARAEL